MRRLNLNKKSLLQRGGAPVPKMTMDTDSVLQGIREKLQGGISEVEVFQNLMDQKIPLDEIQSAFTSLGYDETMLSNIMSQIQEQASASRESINKGNIEGSTLPQAQAGNIGITPGMALRGAMRMPTSGFFGTVSTANANPITGYRPARNFYLPQNLGNKGNVDGALGVLAQGFNNMFSSQDTDGDGLMDGSFRDNKAKRLRQKDRRGSYYNYEVTFDPNDSEDNYFVTNKDLFDGKLRTKDEYNQDLMDNSKLNYNVNTGQYDMIYNPYSDKFLNSANNQLKNRLSKNKRLSGNMMNLINDGVSLSDFTERLKNNPGHAELLAQDFGLLKDDKLPAGVSYGVNKDGAAASYFGANPYLYDTMMLNNVYTGDPSQQYSLDMFNLKRQGGGTVGIDGGSIDMGKIDSRSIDVENLDSASILQRAQFGFDLAGYLKGEQGFIPDYKGQSTKQTISQNPTVNKALDYTQTGLTVAGMQDYSGPIAAGADLLNSALSGVRAYAAPEGSEQRKVHTENAILNASSAVPGYGLATAAGSLIKDTAGYAGVMDTNTSIGTQATDAITNPAFKKGNITQAIGVGNQPNIKGKASRGTELPVYQNAGGIPTTEQQKLDLEAGMQQLRELQKQRIETINLNNTRDESSVYDLVRKGDIPGIERKVNESLGGVMDKEAGLEDIPGYKQFEEAEIAFYQSDEYQNVVDQLNSLYMKEGQLDHVQEQNLYRELDNLEKKFRDSDIGRKGEVIRKFYTENADPLRHGTTSGLTARAISDKIKSTPYIGGLLDFVGADDMAGIIGANALGLGHEVSAYMDYGKDSDRTLLTQIKESGKDMYNNFLGSLTSVGSDSDKDVVSRVIQGVRDGDYTTGKVDDPNDPMQLILNDQMADPPELDMRQNAGETNKERKKRIKDYDHPYLQQYIEQFGLNNKGDETAVKDIMSQMGVTGADTLLLGSSQNLGMAKRMANFDLLQHIANEINPDGGQTTVTYKDRIPFNTGPVDDDGNSYNMDEKTWYNDDGGYLHTIKSLLNAKKPLDEKQDGGANTLYEYYSGMGQDLPSIPERGAIYQDANLGQQYSGTAAQNTQLLQYLQDPANATIPDDEIQQNIELDEFTVTAPAGDFPRLEPIGIQPLEVDPPDMQLRGLNIAQTGDPAATQTEDPTAMQDPKIKRKNKLMGTVNRIKDSRFVEKFGDVSNFLVAGAGVINEMFKNRKARKAEEDLVYSGMADKAYGMVESREGDRGLTDENTGIIQPDNIRAYEARMGKETFMMPPMKQEENIVDLDYKTVAKLISAGADIEIL